MLATLCVGLASSLAAAVSSGWLTTVGETTVALAIDRAGPADTGVGDDTLADLANGDDGGVEVSLPNEFGVPAAGVGSIGCSVNGVADGAADDTTRGAAERGAEGPCTEIAGLETTIADPAVDGLFATAFAGLGFGSVWSAKAELRSAVIRSYIRLGLSLVDREDVPEAEGDEEDDETGLVVTVALDVFRDGLEVTVGVAEMLAVGLWAPKAACPLLTLRVPPGDAVGVEFRRLKAVLPPVRLPCWAMALPARVEVLC